MSNLAARIANLSPEKRAILSKRLQAQSSDPDPITQVEHPGSLVALSFAEEQLWFIHQMDSNSAAYNMPLAIEMRGDLCVESLRRSLNHVADRHSLLRSEYVSIDGRPARRVFPAGQVDLECESISADASKHSINAWIQAAAGTAFELNRVPLIRAKLARLDRERHILLLVVHHIICDASSMALLIRELIACYRHFSRGAALALPPLPVSYGDFAAWQRKLAEGAEFGRHLAYWNKQLAGIAATPAFPTDKDRSAWHLPQYACHSEQLTGESTESFIGLLARESTTAFIGYLSVLILALHASSGLRDIIVGCPITGRVRKEVKDLIGLFANIHILRVCLSGNPTFRQILSEVCRIVSEARDHHQVPYQKVIDRLPRNSQRPSLFQVSFTYDNEFVELPHVPPLEIAPVRVDPSTPMYELDLNITELAGKVVVDWQYDAALFEAATITRLARYFRKIVTTVVASPGIVLTELLCVLSDLEEKRKAEETQRRAQVLGDKLMHSKRRPLKLNNEERRSA
jgi:hypothetical protein